MNKYKKIIFFGIFIAVFGHSVFAASEKLVFSIYGSDFLIGIPLPDYWTVDMDAAYQNNLNGFFYIAEKGINETPVYIFVSLFEKKADKSFLDFIQHRTLSFAEEQPNYSIKKVGGETFKGDVNNWNVEIYEVKVKSGHGHYQIVAYMECENKYYIEIYIDCYQDDYKDNDTYIQDFVECFHELNYLNIQLQE